MGNTVISTSQAIPTSRLLRALRTDLTGWGTPRGLEVELAADVVDAYDRALHDTSGTGRVVLAPAGFAPFGPDLDSPLLERRLRVLITRGQALDPDPSARILPDVAAGDPPAFVDLLDQLVARILAWRLPGRTNAQEYFRITDCRPAALPDGSPLDGFELDISILASGPTPDAHAAVILTI
jgi:hypothetical protein